MSAAPCPCGSARYLPYALCLDCLQAQREKEARELEARMFKIGYKPASEHGIYQNATDSAKYGDAMMAVSRAMDKYLAAAIRTTPPRGEK